MIVKENLSEAKNQYCFRSQGCQHSVPNLVMNIFHSALQCTVKIRRL